MISERTIQQVRDLDIETVLKPYVELKKKGSSLMGLCPFHSEKTPSFSVSPQKNLYNCFGCRRGGDGIDFVMAKENLSFIEAVKKIASDNGIEIEEIGKDLSEEERTAARHKESLLATLDLIHKFYVDCLRANMEDECADARNYAYDRWSPGFCATSGIGYAPNNGKFFIEYCRNNGIDQEVLLELGLWKINESGNQYQLFRRRIIIPIKDRYGRVIAFTARYIDTNANSPKYINSSNSEVYTKGATIFGIDRASKVREKDNIIIVEGAPDVLRLQSIGLDNTVASLGTSWSDAQFSQLRKITSSLCFIPDSDVSDGELYGPGFEAVMANGATAMKKGFVVTVRELPFAEVLLTDEEIRELYSDYDTPSKNVVKVKPGKNDPDSYIRSKEDYTGLEEKYFVVWLAEKRFLASDSIAKDGMYLKEIASLLAHIKDSLVLDRCIEKLSKIHFSIKNWKDAVKQARGEARRSKDSFSSMDERQKDVEALSRVGFFIRNNSYYSPGNDDEEPTIVSNFIMEPLYHISDENNATRIFRLKNVTGDSKLMDIKESELCSLNAFLQKTGSLGNFIWLASFDKLNRIRQYLYARTDTAERVRKLGWDSRNEFFSFGNGIVEDTAFIPVDDMGIVRNNNGQAFYIPATSKMYRGNDEIFQFERMMVYENRSGIRLCDFTEKLIETFGEKARVAFCYLVSTLFRDIIFKKTHHFPILNLFGEKGTGKTTLATSLQSFFIHGIDPPTLSATSLPAMNDRVSQAVNTLVVFDEYKNDLDIRTIGFLKGLWGGGGQTKKNTATDGMATQTIVSTGIAVCGQEKPTQDMALFTRVLFLSFTKTSFNQEERLRYEDLTALCDMGLTHLTVELLKHRRLFEKNFTQAYAMCKSELAAKMADITIHDRIFGNWVIPLATFRTLETALDVPFSYNELFDTCCKCLLEQNELGQESSEIGDFWNTLQGLHASGKFIEGVHFNIRYLNSFRPISATEDMQFKEAKPIIYLNAGAVSALFSGKGGNVSSARSYWSTILSYLKSHNSYLGLKQDRFTILLANGSIDYQIDIIDGVQVRKKKVNRPKALCFDYLQLKETFGIDLETEVLLENET